MDWWKVKLNEVLNETPIGVPGGGICSGSPRCYQLIASEQLVGIVLLLFVRDDLCPATSEVSLSTVKTGIGGISGNKGAVAVRLKLWTTPLNFCVMHLAAHQHNIEERNGNFRDIKTRISFKQDSTSAGAEYALPPLRGPGCVDWRAVDSAWVQRLVSFSTAERPQFGAK